MKYAILLLVLFSSSAYAEETFFCSFAEAVAGLENPYKVQDPTILTPPGPFDPTAWKVGEEIRGVLVTVYGANWWTNAGVIIALNGCTFDAEFKDGGKANIEIGNIQDASCCTMNSVTPPPPSGGGAGLPQCEGEVPIGGEPCIPANSPILLDLDRNQFHLSGGPVLFDIDADGEDESITWVSSGELDGFLYLDRNHNGIVDDGSELFGNATQLFDGSQADHGYQALAEFDLPENGGVPDGFIDTADS